MDPVPGPRAGAYSGGNWSNAANAGLFFLNCNNDASNANTNIGGRLASGHSQKARPHGASSSAVTLGFLSSRQATRMPGEKEQLAVAASSVRESGDRRLLLADEVKYGAPT